MRPRLDLFPQLILFSFLVVGLAFACGTNHQQALKATFASVNTARDGFLAWDKLEQTHIVERATSIADGTATLTAHTERIRPIEAAFAVVYEALALAALEPSDDHVTGALRLAAELYELINAAVFTEEEN